MDKVEIGISRRKTFFLLLGAFGFVIGGIWVIMTSDFHLWEKILLEVSVLFFGAGIPIIIKKLIANKSVLELTKKCLIIEPKSNQERVLSWEEITGFEAIRIGRTKIILIKVNNPNDWINQETNAIKRKMMQFNFRSYGTPFNITSSGLSISHKKLLELLNDFKRNEASS